MEKITTESKKTTLTKFNLFSLAFTPLAKSSLSSVDIMHKVFSYLQDQRVNHKGVLIDRFDKRISEDRRELFMVSSVFIKGKRLRGTLALLRSGKTPLIKPAEKFQLVPLDTTTGSIAEQTTFFIDFSKSKIIVCIEYNYYGPRASDIEYYLRTIAHTNLHIARATEMELFMERSIDRTMEELHNVLSIDVKIQPKKLANLNYEVRNNYFSGMSNLGEKIRPKFLKLQAQFHSDRKVKKSIVVNSEANTMFTKLLQIFKSDKNNMDTFDNFVVKYEDKEGMEQIFNLLKGKYEFEKELSDKEIHNDRLMFDAIEPQFDEFMKLAYA